MPVAPVVKNFINEGWAAHVQHGRPGHPLCAGTVPQPVFNWCVCSGGYLNNARSRMFARALVLSQASWMLEDALCFLSCTRARNVRFLWHICKHIHTKAHTQTKNTHTLTYTDRAMAELLCSWGDQPHHPDHQHGSSALVLRFLCDCSSWQVRLCLCERVHLRTCTCVCTCASQWFPQRCKITHTCVHIRTCTQIHIRTHKNT